MAAEVAEGGKAIELVFYKGNTLIRVDYSNPNGKANIDDMVKLAQQVEKLIPDQIVPPSTLSFPDQLNQEAFNKYFSGLDINIIGSTLRKQVDYTENSLFSIKDNPKAISNQLYVVGLYDFQNQKIMEKIYYEMIGHQENL